MQASCQACRPDCARSVTMCSIYASIASRSTSGVRPSRPECARGTPRAGRGVAGTRPECAHAGQSAPGVRQA